MILSRKGSPVFDPSLLKSVYDWPMLTAILATILVSSALLIQMSRGQQMKRFSPCRILLHTLGIFLKQSFPSSAMLKSGSQSFTVKFTLALVSLGGGVILSSAFSGLVVSKLVKTKPSTQIDHLRDLANFPELKIFVKEATFMQTFLEKSGFYPGLRTRIHPVPLSSPGEMEEVYGAIARGEAVSVDFNLNIRDQSA